jgi:hypothetical protein
MLDGFFRLHCPRFRDFDPDGEFDVIMTEVHTEFCQTLEMKMSEQLIEMGLDSDLFGDVLAHREAKVPEDATVQRLVLTFRKYADFREFGKLMHGKFIELYSVKSPVAADTLGCCPSPESPEVASCEQGRPTCDATEVAPGRMSADISSPHSHSDSTLVVATLQSQLEHTESENLVGAPQVTADDAICADVSQPQMSPSSSSLPPHTLPPLFHPESRGVSKVRLIQNGSLTRFASFG